MRLKSYKVFAAASPTLYYHFEPKFYVNFRQSEVLLNCNIHHTSLKTMPSLVNTQTDHAILLQMQFNFKISMKMAENQSVH